MENKLTGWVLFDGSDEQIAELNECKNGFVVRFNDDKYSALYECIDIDRLINLGFTHYWIIPDDPLREMKIRQAMTGQPVWIKMKSSTYWVIAMRGFDLIYQDHVVSVIKSTTPDWWIPNAEYSFTPFEKEIESKEE